MLQKTAPTHQSECGGESPLGRSHLLSQVSTEGVAKKPTRIQMGQWSAMFEDALASLVATPSVSKRCYQLSVDEVIIWGASGALLFIS